jgi:hypothetical protein
MNNYFILETEDLNFQEAYAAFKQGKCVRRHGSSIVYEPHSSMSMEDTKFSVNDIMATDWEICRVDWEWEDKLDEVRDYVEEAGLVVDTRFYDLDKMDIGEIFNYITNMIDRETEYNILMTLKKEGYRFDKK